MAPGAHAVSCIISRPEFGSLHIIPIVTTRRICRISFQVDVPMHFFYTVSALMKDPE
jgi:hypothetical protein